VITVFSIPDPKMEELVPGLQSLIRTVFIGWKYLMQRISLTKKMAKCDKIICDSQIYAKL